MKDEGESLCGPGVCVVVATTLLVASCHLSCGGLYGNGLFGPSVCLSGLKL